MTQPAPWARFDALVEGLTQLQARAHQAAARSVNEILTVRSWLIGAWIIAFQQEGSDRAQYGEGVIDALAERFAARGIRGLGRSNLRNYRQIALTWPRLAIRQTPSGEWALAGSVAPGDATNLDLIPGLNPPTDALPWQDEAWMARLRTELSFSHLLELSRTADPVGRAFYELQTLSHGWSVRELRRQREAMLYERVGLSRDKDAVLALAQEGQLADTPAAIVRDPYVLEFLGLPERTAWSEADLEAALVAHLQDFLLELGRDFAFMGRQYRITVGGRHHFIDLLFYHRRLRCLVAIDLKIGSFGYEDAGQMNFYLNFLRDNISLPDESPPVGLVLCAEKDAAEVHYATGNLDHQVFVSRYLTQLPSEGQLRTWLEEEQEALARRPQRAGEGDGEEDA